MYSLLRMPVRYISRPISQTSFMIAYHLELLFPCLLVGHRDTQIIYFLCTQLLRYTVFFYKLLICINQRSIFRHSKNTVTHLIKHTFKNFQLSLGSHSFRYITTHNQHVFLIQRKNTVLIIMAFTIKIQFVMCS